MAVQSDTSRIQYAGNNSTTTSYAVPFVFQENSHLKAIARTSAGVESVVTLTNHTGAGNVNGGTVRTAVAVPATSTLTIYREVPATQTTTYAEGGDFPAASHERALDKLTQIAQQNQRQIGASLRLTEANPIAALPLPTAAGQHVLATAGSGTAPSFQSLGSLAIGPVIATGSTIPRSVQDRFADTINVKDFGAVGDGVANDTLAIQAAINAAASGSTKIVFPKGTYSVDPTITVNTPVYIDLFAGCVVLQRSLGSPTGTSGRFGIFTFNAGASGSVLSGAGLLNGNRNALVSQFLQLPQSSYYGGTSYAIEFFYNGIVSYADNLLISNISIANFLGCGVFSGNGNNGNIHDIDISSCTKAMVYQFCSNAKLNNITVTSCNNIADGTAIPVWQHAFEFRSLENCSITNISVDNYSARVKDASGNNIGDPYPITFSFGRVVNSTISNIKAGDYTFDPSDSATTPRSESFEITSVHSCTFNNIVGLGSLTGMSVISGYNNTFSNCFFDSLGNEQVSGVQSAGILVTLGGINEVIGDVDTDYRATATTKDTNFSNIVVSGYFVGMQISSSDVNCTNVKCFNNKTYGFLIWEWIANANFPSGSIPNIERVSLVGCDGSYNGTSGLAYSSGSLISVVGGSYSNNGQDATSGTPLRNGIISVGSGAVTDVNHVGVRASDSQSFTKTKAASFIPATTNAKNQITLLLNNADFLHVGQRVLIVNATGSSNINGKIVRLEKDVAILQCDSSQTFSETGNLTALTGTVSATSGSINLVGSGTAFSTQITGTCYIKIGSSYYRVAKVISNTLLQVDHAGGLPALSGASASLVQCDIQGIPSQQYGMYFLNNATSISFNNCQLTGNVTGATFSQAPTTTYIDSFSSSEKLLYNLRLMSGAGTPEGSVSAPVGSMYLNSSGGTGTSLYIKESGSGNTGWVAK